MDIKVLKGSSACAQPPLRRAPRASSREILTLPHRRLSASLPHHGPPPATPRPMTYHPRDNATAHGPRDNVLPPATPPRDNAPPPATQLPRRSPDNVAGAPEPSSRRPHTPAPSPAHPATQLRTRPPPTQPSAVTHDRRSSPRTRHQRSDTPSDAAPHDVTRAPEQSIRAPHSYPTTHQCSDTGRGAKHHRAPSTTVSLVTPRHHGRHAETRPECNQETEGVPNGITPSQQMRLETAQLLDDYLLNTRLKGALRERADFPPQSSSNCLRETQIQSPLHPTMPRLLSKTAPLFLLSQPPLFLFLPSLNLPSAPRPQNDSV